RRRRARSSAPSAARRCHRNASAPAAATSRKGRRRSSVRSVGRDIEEFLGSWVLRFLSFANNKLKNLRTQEPKNMTTIVLFGGPSAERNVSVASAQAIVRTLGDVLAWFWAPGGAVHDVALADLLAHERPFEVDFVPPRPSAWPTIEQALDTLPVDDPVFVLALHGTGGEDGVLQRMMERRGIPFTGSDSEASAAAFDKGRAKEIVAGNVRIAES